MKQLSHLPSRISLVAALVAALACTPAWAVDSGSTGADGALNPTVNTEIVLPASGILNYTTVNIPVGVTVKFKPNAANTPVYLLASGDVTIAGTIDVNGQDAAATGTDGDGNQGDDGVPGLGGPGGFAGGRGGRDDAASRPAIIRGGAGLGPGGGIGGIEGGNSCTATGYYHYVGAGGAYGANAYQYYAVGNCGASVSHANAYGSTLLQPLVGGSGGGGGVGGTNYPGSGGGGGGGAILIAASGTLKITGSVTAIGGDGGGLAGTGVGGRGAGGSGGAIRLLASNVTGNGTLYAVGGCINVNGSRRQSCGSDGGYNQYGGSIGRIRIEGDAISYTGTNSPTYVRGDVGPVFIAGAPTLRIASVAGQAVPAVPTGSNDVTLPATTTDPVSITFETANVPVGNTVQLRVVPAYGTTSEAISPAITGSTAAGTAALSIVLPQGPSTLQATTTYTVIVASMEDRTLIEKLSRLAQNERVEKVEVTVALQGGARARLITDSGKTFEMPYEALSAVGFKG
ncbi:SbsA Ig-like domain-containing protein [Rhodanobacter sp. Root179]|uniref:hypothetical protein n=1 Tax=Rhodanobacter sp. Root179 TaxID=1736482 RepID=UPI0006FBD6FF|nr:hypothetical protein [Rhodanobacter sp. Root179]KRB41780.1 hypothetical protein ASD82_08765 [Rhodanobacter sp. Root179]